MRKAEAFARTIDTINGRVGRVASYLVLPLLAITLMEVILRYVFNKPTTWGWDVNIQVLAGLTLLGAGYTLLKQGHIIIDIFTGRLSPRKRAILDMATALLFFFGIGALVYQGSLSGWHSVETRELYTSVWNPPIYYIKMVIPIGAALLFFQGLSKFIRDLNIALHGKTEDTLAAKVEGAK